jgi:AcrR family transcriptional regulator
MVSKKERILNAAEALFAEKGFTAATVEEVAKRAGIGKSTVYEYFGSKDEIFRQTLKAGLESYMEAMKGRLKTPCSVRDVLTAIGSAHFNFVREHTFTARLLADEYNDTPWARQWVLELRERRTTMFASLIRQGIADGEFRLTDPRLAAEVLLGVINALCSPLLNNAAPDAVTPERFHRGIAVFFEGMLA